jgi:hypothetical protein
MAVRGVAASIVGIETLPGLELAFPPGHTFQYVRRRYRKASAQEQSHESAGNYDGHDNQGNGERGHVLPNDLMPD